jgi:hypothetical protein
MRIRILATVSLLFVASTVPFVVSAGPGYTWVDVDYVNFDPDNGRTLDGPRIGGSYRIADQIHAVGGYARLTNGPWRLHETQVALGYHATIAEGSDVVIRGGLMRHNLRRRNLGGVSENALLLQGGVRSMVTPELELNGLLTYADFDDSMTSLDLLAVFHFSPTFGMTLGAGFASERTFYNIGLRVSL